MTWIIPLALIVGFAIGYAGPAYDCRRLERALKPFAAIHAILRDHWHMGPEDELTVTSELSQHPPFRIGAEDLRNAHDAIRRKR
ncbi:MAG: hypothetical protein E6Q97_18595 [Desulfurellales bacterium]|nr:MAG: hypothetical protein E6Q97_18595 [Desulfurellales bacterium]